jgi:hypothetical protein
MVITRILAPILLLATSSQPTTAPTSLALWPGYTVQLPADHCVALDRRVDFDLVYFHRSSDPKGPILLGIYSGHNPENLDCTGAKKHWEANGLAFDSARGPGDCAEFLIQDPKKPERGFLHIWFGPAAKDHQRDAEAVVASVRMATLPVYRPDNLPLCP